MNDRPAVALIGASVRAAAYSALRAGLAPFCIDLFADVDLRAIAATRRLCANDYPHGFAELLETAPSGAVLYTGGLENDPALIDRIASKRTVWGNSGHVLRVCRDPFWIKHCLEKHGFCSPNVARERSIGSMLRKPLHSAGGCRISFATIEDKSAPGFYFQEYIPGHSFSASYCALADRCVLIGTTRQLVGESWLHARPFRYCGSIGPVALTTDTIDTLVKLGEVLSAKAGLRGLFGIDFILRDEVPWPVELNPRYTASMEILEHAIGTQMLSWQRAAFDPNYPPPHSVARGSEASFGKAIVFAPKRFPFPVTGTWRCPTDIHAFPSAGDIPSPGETIEAGAPIMTVFAKGPTVEACRQSLQSSAATLLNQLGMVS